MSNEIATIQRHIFELRGQRVMLDFDLAALYGVETRRLNEQVKRNIERFPEDFMFQLTRDELELIRLQLQPTENWMSQNATSSKADSQGKTALMSQNATSSWGGTRKLPYAFTENGVAMLSSVLRSPQAIQVNISIMRVFTQFRHLAATLPAPSDDVRQLRHDFEELKQDIEELLADQNDINEDTRLQLENITQALAELQAKQTSPNKPRPRIGFI